MILMLDYIVFCIFGSRSEHIPSVDTRTTDQYQNCPRAKPNCQDAI